MLNVISAVATFSEPPSRPPLVAGRHLRVAVNEAPSRTEEWAQTHAFVRALIRSADLRYDRPGGFENFEFYCKTNYFLAADNCGRLVNL